MAIQAGLVGLPNVGKSTLFNALTKSSVPAQNYPFCTVDPHVAVTEVPDPRLDKLAQIFGSQKTIPTIVQFVDIAGLVKGASQGEGLGNQFLGNVMNVDLVLHVVRCFEDDKITHVHNAINPFDDLEVISAELMLKDLESIEKKEEKVLALIKSAKNRNLSSHELKELEGEKSLILEVKGHLHAAEVEKVQQVVKTYAAQGIQTVPLLSAKNFLIIANLSEQDVSGKEYLNNQHYQNLIEKYGQDIVIPVCAKIESELVQLSDEEKAEMMESFNMEESGLDNIIRHAYNNLGLISFFTCGPKEAHAWGLKKGTKVVNAAGTIHSDLERGFICAEVYNCQDLFDAKTEAALRSSGKIRTEGKDYIVQDGDLLLIRFNV